MVEVAMSLGKSMRTGPGRPVVATWKAAATTLGMSSTSLINQLCLVIPMVTPVMSHSWKASVPMEPVATWPDTTISGVESMYALASGVTMLVAPGPLVTMATPGLPVTMA
jgi:hypothetical protein